MTGQKKDNIFRLFWARIRKFFDFSSLSFIENGRKMTLFSLALPAFLQTFFSSLIGTVNTLLLSGYADDAVGATTAANQIISTATLILNMTYIGAAVLVSIEFGKGNREGAKRITGCALILTFISGCIFSLALIFAAEPMLVLLNLEGEALDYGKSYLAIRGGALFIVALNSFFAGMLICNGYTLHAFIKGVIGNVANVILGYIFLYGKIIPSLTGTSAIAVGGIIATTIELIFAAIVFLRLKCPIRPAFSISLVKSILFIGAPGSVSGISYTLAQVITTGFMGGIGIIALNAKSYVASIVYYTYLFSYAIGIGTKILMGRYAGSGDVEKRKQLFRASLIMAIFANIFFSLAVLIFHKPLISIFTESKEILAIVPLVFLVDIAVEGFRAINHVSESSLNANKDVFTTLLASTISCWLGSVLLSYILGIWLGLGLLGCWIAFACDEGIKAIIYLIRWKSGKWIKRSESLNPELTEN